MMQKYKENKQKRLQQLNEIPILKQQIADLQAMVAKLQKK